MYSSKIATGFRFEPEKTESFELFVPVEFVFVVVVVFNVLVVFLFCFFCVFLTWILVHFAFVGSISCVFFVIFVHLILDLEDKLFPLTVRSNGKR